MKKIYNGQRTDKLYIPPGLNVGAYEIKNIQLKNIVDKIWGAPAPLKITLTPHFRYLLGDKDPLRKYFLACRGITWARKGTEHENMTVDYLISTFDDIVNSDKDYLQPPYDSHYIIVTKNLNCLDGLRRACVLLSNGIEEAPVAVV